MQVNVTAPKVSSGVAAGFDFTSKCRRCKWLRLDVFTFTLQRWAIVIRDGRTCSAVEVLSTDNFEREMEELRGRGVVFEEHGMPGLKTENGIATNDWRKSAWFLDSERDILNISPRA